MDLKKIAMDQYPIQGELEILQPRSQGLSSLAPGGSKMRDPGNEVGNTPGRFMPQKPG